LSEVLLEQFDRSHSGKGVTRAAMQILVVFTLVALFLAIGTGESVAQQSENTASKNVKDKAVVKALPNSQTSSGDSAKSMNGKGPSQHCNIASITLILRT
jgi:hypothetical protein